MNKYIFSLALSLLLSCPPHDAGVPAWVEGTTQAPGTFDTNKAKLKVDLEPENDLLLVRNVNLDEDGAEEQILLTYQKTSADPPIQVLVVDYDPPRSIHFVSWRGEVQAISKNHVSVDTLDIIGDQRLEILVLGMNATGRQTIDVFRRDPGFQQGLLYTKVFSQNALGLIEVQKKERSEFYATGRLTDTPFPILIEEDDPNPEAGPLDVIRTTWIWRYQVNTFIPSLIEKIPRQLLNVTGAEDFGQTNTDGMKRILDGVWVRPGTPSIYLNFQPTHDKMTYRREHTMEIYDWTNTIRTRANVLTLQGVNTLTLDKRFPLQVQYSLYLISRRRMMVLSSYPDETLPGLFTKVEGGLSGEAPPQPIFPLHGSFVEEGGTAIDFQAPHLVWQTGTDRKEGGFSLFFLNRWILQIRLLSVSGRPIATQNFTVDFNQTRENVQIQREITLTPVALHVDGVIPAEGPHIRLQQVKILNDPH